ncbi:nucleoside hydrolase [Niabella aurantiaca]|uniref:nucleoside hydrolase n=1 Tax=Niabella aurantiaca TaxID=379900 RepID=UPI00037B8BC5|nr:nucleoside hydrolase [Niabella aurantiaca]
MKQLYLCLLAISFGLFVQSRGQVPLKVIFDTDMGPDYDDVGAMAVLHSFADQGKIDIKAVMSSNAFDLTGPTIQILNEYFHRPGIPVGVPKGKALNYKSPFCWNEYLVARYPVKRKNYEDAVALYRKVLSEAADKSITIITVGFLTNLSDLLDSKADSSSNLTGRELVARKVRNLYCMGGRFPQGKEYNIRRDPLASKNVVDNWPASIYFLGFEVGIKILTGKEFLTDYSIKNSPIKDVNIIVLPQRDEDANGRMSWDQATVLAAVDNERKYFNVVRGDFLLNADGANSWKDNAEGNHYYFTPKASIEAITKAIKLLMYR